MNLPTDMRTLLLVAVVVIAAAWDVRTRRIPNALTLGGTAAGLLLAAVGAGAGPGFGAAVAGSALGLALLLPLYAIRALGAGDAKLMAAVGAFVGAPAMVFVVLLTGVAGGVAALALAARAGMLRRLVANTRALFHVTAFAAMHGQRPDLATVPSAGRLPYGVCICAGTLAWLALRHGV